MILRFLTKSSLCVLLEAVSFYFKQSNIPNSAVSRELSEGGGGVGGGWLGFKSTLACCVLLSDGE